MLQLSIILLNLIKSKNGTCKVYPAPFAVQLGEWNNTIVEPDISVICNPEKLTEKGCQDAPDWIIEITSPSNSGHDYIRKFSLYEKTGVREYWIVNPMKKIVTVYFFEGDGSAQLYTFQEKIPVNIYEDFVIDFAKI